MFEISGKTESGYPNQLSATLFLGDTPYACHFNNTRTNLDRPAVWLRNHVFICPQCGKQWGALLYHEPQNQTYGVCSGTCYECGDGRLGQFVDLHNPDIPFDLLLYELEREHALGYKHLFTFYTDNEVRYDRRG